MTAPTVVPFTRRIPGPDLSRDRRRAELERIAEDAVLAVPLSATSLTILLRAYGAPSLSLDDLISRWHDLIAEYRRWLGAASSDGAWAGTDLDLAVQDREAAMAGLLDGTNTYHGVRTK